MLYLDFQELVDNGVHHFIGVLNVDCGSQINALRVLARFNLKDSLGITPVDQPLQIG
ncbi:MAG: hypothetical protein Q7R39_07535 [Dehalococcoidia bacterium]|nr:hypothetical protein [Dehalococcoidia bacterium]